MQDVMKVFRTCLAVLSAFLLSELFFSHFFGVWLGFVSLRNPPWWVVLPMAIALERATRRWLSEASPPKLNVRVSFLERSAYYGILCWLSALFGGMGYLSFTGQFAASGAMPVVPVRAWMGIAAYAVAMAVAYGEIFLRSAKNHSQRKQP